MHLIKFIVSEKGFTAKTFKALSYVEQYSFKKLTYIVIAFVCSIFIFFSLPQQNAFADCFEGLESCLTSCSTEESNDIGAVYNRDTELQEIETNYKQDVSACTENRDSGIENYKIDYELAVRQCETSYEKGAPRDDCVHRAESSYSLGWNFVAVGYESCRTRASAAYDVGIEGVSSKYNSVFGKTETSVRNTAKFCNDDCGSEYKGCKKGEEEEKEEEDDKDPKQKESENQMRETPCPLGSEPNPLGACEVKLERKDAGNSSDDHAVGSIRKCPKGLIPGKNDKCVPDYRKITFVPASGTNSDGWILICPAGLKPGPVDACIVDKEAFKPTDSSTVTVGGELNPNGICPPGTRPAPDDGGCIPIFPKDNSFAPDIRSVPRINGIRVRNLDVAIQKTLRNLQEIDKRVKLKQ